jgi:hypothetical protein
MIKECKVLSCNPFLNIIVIDFDGKTIQMTGKIDKDIKTIFVKYEDGVATISSKEDYEKSLKPKAVKKPKKVEAIEEIVESEAVENEADEISE